ncbi:hydroxymethylbilane synthase [Lishizhenia tianjinensis]|uniref:Hydroxymethylbilane synthase n=1 Tax=Lishizhenia tianjinensis TaxID=477690 RepID=A0A1I7B3D8_9FLAO|nr:hydroxymethylbilane synthase [Lishizhenia tianjinensis]SFT81713.1 hydroxymethylbilane synthase [Lishizhenia tianjinensis]
MEKIIIGSRGSDLALWQANFVKSELEKLNCEVEIKIIKTQGDMIQNLSFDKLEGKGFFTKEIEKELLDGTVDLAVHSHKDLETNPPAGLKIAAVSDREDPAELLLINPNAVDENYTWSLKKDAVIGTSSARRKSLVVRSREDLEIKDLRGNVPTRIQKLKDGNYDAILLAKAGVSRLQINLDDLKVVELDPTEFVPAPAQGVLGLQIREGDTRVENIVSKLNNAEVAEKIGVERKVLNLLEGGCQLPLGVYCPNTTEVYVSYAQNWQEGADWFKFDADDLEGMAEFIVEELQNDNE